VFALFYFVIEGSFRVQAPLRGGFYLEGRFLGGCFALQVWGSLYLEGLIFGILRYYVVMLGEVFIIIFKSVKEVSAKKWPTLWSRNPNYSRVFFRHVLHKMLDA